MPVTVAGFFLIARASRFLAALWLALASLFFYGWWNPRYVVLLLASIAFNYAAGYSIARAGALSRAGARRLGAAVVANLALLAYYKYANFFLGAAGDVAGGHWHAGEILLPLGISFFTFTQIAFLVDAHRGIAREYRLVHYLLFVTYFPHLIAGPILHHGQLIPQLEREETYRFRAEALSSGLTLFAIGVFKKVMLADPFATFADPVFDGAAKGAMPAATDAWIGAFAYTLQIYFDFSGYSDMALGLSRMLNIALPMNFDSPYRATSIIEFWRRWHMTLSAFLRDYLYIPLGGNRHGAMRRHLNLMVTMLLGGLWHGANWTFVAWGGLHGFFLAANHAWRAAARRLRLPALPGAPIAAAALTFLAVVLAWVAFRADSIGTALGLWNVMLHVRDAWAGRSDPARAHALWFIGSGLAIVWLLPNAVRWVDPFGSTAPAGKRLRIFPDWRPTLAIGLLVGAMLAVSIARFGKPAPFLYFQF